MAGAKQRLSWESECFSSFAHHHSGFKEGANGEELSGVAVMSKAKTKRKLPQNLNLDPHLPFIPDLMITISCSYSRLKGEKAELGQLFLLWEIY